MHRFTWNLYNFDIDVGHGQIDKLSDHAGNPEEKFRYAFWSSGKKISDKPDVILYDGTVEYYGTASNSDYIFKNGEYTYRFKVTHVGHRDTPPYALVIYKGDKEIATYPATVLEGSHIW